MASLLKAAEVKLDRIRQYDPTLPGISIEALPGKNVDVTATDVNVNATGEINYSATAHRFTGAVETSRVAQTTPQLLHIQHRITGTGNSGTFTAGAWRRRPVNHLVQNTIPDASFDAAGNQFTLPAGLYWMELYSMGFYVQANVIRLRNVTDLVDIDYGDAGMSNPAAGYNNTGSTFRGYVTLDSAKLLAVDHYCSTSRASDGFGYKNALGTFPGIFANYMIWKVN